MVTCNYRKLRTKSIYIYSILLKIRQVSICYHCYFFFPLDIKKKPPLILRRKYTVLCPDDFYVCKLLA